jgi:hypothetical protein
VARASSEFTAHYDPEESQAKMGIFKPCKFLPIAFVQLNSFNQIS